MNSSRAEAEPRARNVARADLARRALLLLAFGLLLVVGLSRPNASQPGLGPRGWAPGTLLPVTLGPAAVTATMWTAYTAGAIALLLALRSPARELPRLITPVLAAAAALTAPFGSADHLSYTAYGRILVQGGNPWLVSPHTWRGDADPVVSAVEVPWREEPSVYGPFATMLHALASLVGGDNLRQTVWVWQLVVIVAWLAIRWLLRDLLPDHRRHVDVLWTANPLVFSVGVLGAHVDTVATALVVAAVWAIHRYAGLPGALLAGGFAGLALSSKFTYAVVLLAIALALRQRRVARGLAMLAGAVVVAGALHLWAGPHVYDQVGRSSRAVSLASPWRWVLEAAGGGEQVRLVIAVGAGVMAIVFAICLAALTRPPAGSAAPETTGEGARSLRWLVVLTGAYALAASYTLPWYDVIVWAGLPALLVWGADISGTSRRWSGATRAVVTLLLVRLWVMACAYTPGRVVGMTPDVESLTMWVRREVAPLALLVVWGTLIGLGVRALLRARRSARN